jgi:SAM-dependent methyltransferase
MTRLDASHAELDGDDKGTRQIINLLNYTKRSVSAYAGAGYEVGYHSFTINGKHLGGQRDPEQRLALADYDFSGKTVLDIGCNQGGMLFPIADRIGHGIGIDYDSRMVNAANRIRSHLRASTLDFYVFDLQNERLEFIKDFLPDDTVDICFLLSVCMWLTNWRDVVEFARDVSDTLLFESNGKPEQQDEQIGFLHELYGSVRLLSDMSDDDPGLKTRKLLICSDARPGEQHAQG